MEYYIHGLRCIGHGKVLKTPIIRNASAAQSKFRRFRFRRQMCQKYITSFDEYIKENYLPGHGHKLGHFDSLGCPWAVCTCTNQGWAGSQVAEKIVKNCI